MDEVRRSKRIVSIAAGLAVAAIAGFWVTRGDARSEGQSLRAEKLTLEEPLLSGGGMRGIEFLGPAVRVPLVERMAHHFGLSKDQIEKAQAIADRYGPRLRELRDRTADDEAIRVEADGLRTERNKQLSAILTPEQRKLLPSFSWRLPMGPMPPL
jgi:hypothetical protein